MKTRLSTILIICFLVISLGPLALVAALSYSQAQRRLSKEIASELRLIADTKARQLATYVLEKKNLVSVLAYSPTLVAAMGELEQVFKTKGMVAPEYAEIDRRIRPFLAFRKQKLEFHDLLLLALDGQVIFSVEREDDLGTNLRSGPYKDSSLAQAFHNASQSPPPVMSDFDFYPPSNKIAAFIAVPLEKEGIIVGFLAAQLDIDGVSAIAHVYTGLGQTGEIVVGRKTGDEVVFLTPTRHDPEASFKRRYPLAGVSRRPLAAAVQEVNGEGAAKDYLAHDVWAVWRYLPDVNWGMVVKVDTAEAFAPLAEMRNTAVSIAGLATCLVLLGALGVGRWIGAPIVGLQDSTRQLALGIFSHRARESRIVEVTDLARAFNTMAGQIEDHTTELDRTLQALKDNEIRLESRVCERTQELETSNNHLQTEIAERGRAEESLRRSEERFRNAFDHTPIGMALVSPEGRWLQVNPALCKITGYSEQELLERTFQDITHPDDLEADLEFARRMLAGDLPSFCLEKRYIRKDGQCIWVLLSVSRSHNDIGKPFQFVAQTQDISERKRAEEALANSNARLKGVLDGSTQVSIIATDTNGLITVFNTGAEHMFGYAAEEMIGRQTPVVIHLEAEIQARGEELTRELGRPIAGMGVFVEPARRGDETEREWTCVRKDGSHLIASLVVTALRDQYGKIVGSMGIVRDITEARRIEAALRASEARFRLIMANVLDYVGQVSTEGIHEYVAPSSLALLGYSPDQLQGKPIFSFAHPDDADKCGKLLSTVMQDGVPARAEIRIRHAEGQYLWLEVVGNPVLDEQGHVRGGTITARDISDRKRSEGFIRLLSAAVEQCPASVVITDRNASMVYVNRTFCEVTGYTSQEVLGKNPRLLKSGEMSAERYRELWQTITEGRVWRCEFHNRKKNGELFWESASISPVLDDQGVISHFVAVKEDITERKRVEEKRRELLAELDRSNKELEQFAYVASHDLQEPLRMVSSYTQLLARRYKGRLDADADEFIAFAVDGAFRMQRLINDLLSYSRVGTRGKEFESTDCAAFYDQAIANLRAAIKENGAEVTCGPLPTVMADKSQIGQLLQNLIGNAIKYHGDEPPRVHVSAEQRENEWVFSVRDNGIGIDPQYADRIFVIFQRLHNREEYAGTGIGLAICKKIVERHGGRIWLESQLGSGAKFCFTIPTGNNGHLKSVWVEKRARPRHRS